MSRATIRFPGLFIMGIACLALVPSTAQAAPYFCITDTSPLTVETLDSDAWDATKCYNDGPDGESTNLSYNTSDVEDLVDIDTSGGGGSGVGQQLLQTIIQPVLERLAQGGGIQPTVLTEGDPRNCSKIIKKGEEIVIITVGRNPFGDCPDGYETLEGATGTTLGAQIPQLVKDILLGLTSSLLNNLLTGVGDGRTTDTLVDYSFPDVGGTGFDWLFNGTTSGYVFPTFGDDARDDRSGPPFPTFGDDVRNDPDDPDSPPFPTFGDDTPNDPDGPGFPTFGDDTPNGPDNPTGPAGDSTGGTGGRTATAGTLGGSSGQSNGSTFSGSADGTGFVGRMCTSRPWASGFLGRILPDAPFNALCSRFGYGADTSTATQGGQSNTFTSTPVNRGITCAPHIVQPGNEATISFSCGDASLSAIAGFTLPNRSLRQTTVAPTTDTAYGIRCSDGFENFCTVRVAAPEASIWAEPQSVRLGARTFIIWDSEGVDRCQITGPSFFETALRSSSATVPITAATTYTITCRAPDGTIVSDSTVVDIAL